MVWPTGIWWYLLYFVVGLILTIMLCAAIMYLWHLFSHSILKRRYKEEDDIGRDISDWPRTNDSTNTNSSIREPRSSGFEESIGGTELFNQSVRTNNEFGEQSLLPLQTIRSNESTKPNNESYTEFVNEQKPKLSFLK